MIDAKAIDSLVKKQKLQPIDLSNDADEVKAIAKDFYDVTGVSADSSDMEQYIIHNCSEDNSRVDFTQLRRICENYDGTATPVTYFKTWESERKAYWEHYDTLKNGVEKKKFAEFFKKKVSLYKNTEETVYLKVDNSGINYLEYKSAGKDVGIGNAHMEGFVYNVSFYELRKLFNAIGHDLFRWNVRYGLEDNIIGKELRRVFKEYITFYLYEQIVKGKRLLLDAEALEKVEEFLEVGDEENQLHHPKNFWFYHNGITIFSLGEREVNRSEATIALIPSEVSVINGAQTMMNFFFEVEFTVRQLQKILPGKHDEVINLVDEALKETHVKTVIISGDEDFVHPITTGLNTQIPIMIEDIAAGTKDAEVINKVLSGAGIKIIKPGETPSVQNAIALLEFVKHFLVVEGYPGTAKNYKKGSIKDDLKRIKTMLGPKAKKDDTQSKKYLIGLQNVSIIEQWWNGEKKKIATETPEDVVLSKYGKNYFQSYVVARLDSEVDDYDLARLYGEFVDDAVRASGSEPLKLEDFKRDALFHKLRGVVEARTGVGAMKNGKEVKIFAAIDEGMLGSIKERLNQTFDGKYKYTQSKVIAECLAENGIEITGFRTINLLRGRCKEHFPMQRTTFSELQLLDAKKKRPVFERSNFMRQVERSFPVFVIEREIGQDGMEHVEKVQFIPDFSFSDFTTEARAVYDATLRAFEDGDVTMFPRAGEKKGFHIRPKGTSASDTFEFTNGEHITKRTFWANKETVECIIKDRLDP